MQSKQFDKEKSLKRYFRRKQQQLYNLLLTFVDSLQILFSQCWHNTPFATLQQILVKCQKHKQCCRFCKNCPNLQPFPAFSQEITFFNNTQNYNLTSEETSPSPIFFILRLRKHFSQDEDFTKSSCQNQQKINDVIHKQYDHGLLTKNYSLTNNVCKSTTKLSFESIHNTLWSFHSLFTTQHPQLLFNTVTTLPKQNSSLFRMVIRKDTWPLFLVQQTCDFYCLVERYSKKKDDHKRNSPVYVTLHIMLSSYFYGFKSVSLSSFPCYRS